MSNSSYMKYSKEENLSPLPFLCKPLPTRPYQAVMKGYPSVRESRNESFSRSFCKFPGVRVVPSNTSGLEKATDCCRLLRIFFDYVLVPP